MPLHALVRHGFYAAVNDHVEHRDVNVGKAFDVQAHLTGFVRPELG